MYDPKDLHLLTPAARAKSDGFEEHMSKFMARNKENARLDNEARAKARGPLPPQPTLAEVKQQLADAKKRHASLGGSNWQYADSNQNMTSGEREARKLESTILDLNRQMRQLQPKDGGEGYAKGGKIDLKDCRVSTTPKGKKSSSW
jgi:hypothetical protein